MQSDIRLPQLAAEITTARLSIWLKREGDRVEAGEPIVEFETDKTNVEIEAPVSGVLQGIRFPSGTDAVPIGSVLAVIVPVSVDDDVRVPVAAPTIDRSLNPAIEVEPPSAAGGHPRFALAPEAPASAGGVVAALAPTTQTRVPATPLATMMAKVAGLDLNTVRPTGRDGRVTKADIGAVLQAPSRQQVSAISVSRKTAKLSAATGGFHDVALSAMRRGTAARSQDAKQSIPHFYLQTDCQVDALLAFRQQINATLTDLRISVTDFVVFAVAQALVRVPQANSMWNEDSVRVFDDVDISVAVNTPKGLITPILRRAQTKTLTTLARELKDLAEQARRGSLKPDQYTGGTVTISNLGMFRVTSIVPIVNPPQACIIGIGSIERKPVVVGDTLAAGAVMSVTLAADHRAIDGATGAELVSELRRLLEEPVWLALRA